jgi:hypothetical protein
MIILDTNVVSEFMTSPPAPAVRAWLNDQDAATLYFTTISIGEIAYGLRAMPDGKRRALLAERFDRFVAQAFKSRILGFDEAAAHVYGELRAARRSMGRPMSAFDGQIAAIAAVNGCAVATRNVKDFEACGLELIKPFAGGDIG